MSAAINFAQFVVQFYFLNDVWWIINEEKREVKHYIKNSMFFCDGIAFYV